ncbi:MAG TPA: patatin-like phospholipase family protein [Solirubrobacteraceae bacterium]|jgi:NTE family protein|nr:patatin-like phospholipase family protein [Solirubrobacteraceae bacterium]
MNGGASSARSTVAVVLPGGGARGAYEIGALSVLLPALQARGERVSVYCGTSVGAINATTMASLAHLPVEEQVSEALRRWRELRKRDVIAPIAGGGGARTTLRLLAHVLGVYRVSLASLLDPTPLRSSLDRWIDWRMLARNVERGVVDSVCVVATSLASGGPVAFVSCRESTPGHIDEGLRYVKARLGGEHVRASAAIPLLFPAVEINSPRTARGHYIDGGTRLNSPIKPALHLGADRVIVVGLEPFAATTPRASSRHEPRIADVAANVIDGLLVDQVGNDLRRLAAINSFFAEDASVGTSRAARAYRLARGHQPYRPISYALVSPRRRGEIGRLADTVFERRFGGARGLLDPDYLLLSRILGGRTRSRGELLSFLMFDSEFTEALIEMAQRDAHRWLRRHPSFWCRDAAHDLSVGAIDRGRVQEEETLDEFRSRHRR